jgi:hypothetical protein
MLHTFVYGVSDNSVAISSVPSREFESKCPRKPLMDCDLEDDPAVQGMQDTGAPLGEHNISKFSW